MGTQGPPMSAVGRCRPRWETSHCQGPWDMTVSTAKPRPDEKGVGAAGAGAELQATQKPEENVLSSHSKHSCLGAAVPANSAPANSTHPVTRARVAHRCRLCWRPWLAEASPSAHGWPPRGGPHEGWG